MLFVLLCTLSLARSENQLVFTKSDVDSIIPALLVAWHRIDDKENRRDNASLFHSFCDCKTLCGRASHSVVLVLFVCSDFRMLATFAVISFLERTCHRSLWLTEKCSFHRCNLSSLSVSKVVWSSDRNGAEHLVDGP